MIFNSQDGERSMNTYLGISGDLSIDDIPTNLASRAAFVFLEGYLFDKNKGKEAFVKLARDTKLAGGKTGIAISDPFCVERHRGDFLNLIENDLDFVIGNEDEIKSLFETEDLEKALNQTSKICALVVCTKADKGVTAIKGAQRVDVGVKKISPIDTTGAGDQFAAGFLYGMASNCDLETSCKMGNIAAGEVIGHIGPRPKVSVKDLFIQSELISGFTDAVV
jgi:sugar/nucleoside kinase (ribokinase family)